MKNSKLADLLRESIYPGMSQLGQAVWRLIVSSAPESSSGSKPANLIEFELEDAELAKSVSGINLGTATTSNLPADLWDAPSPDPNSIQSSSKSSALPTDLFQPASNSSISKAQHMSQSNVLAAMNAAYKKQSPALTSSGTSTCEVLMLCFHHVLTVLLQLSNGHRDQVIYIHSIKTLTLLQVRRRKTRSLSRKMRSRICYCDSHSYIIFGTCQKKIYMVCLFLLTHETKFYTLIIVYCCGSDSLCTIFGALKSGDLSKRSNKMPMNIT